MTTYVIILIAVIILGIPTIIVVNKFPKIRLAFQIVYFVLIVVFGYLLFVNINKPIAFDRELDKRYDATVERLKDIRTIQIVYKDKYGKYTGGLDTIINFVKHDSLEISKTIQVKEWNQDEVTKEEAFKTGILVKSSSYVPVFDSLWGKSGYSIEQIKYVPYIDNVEFTMGAGEVETASKVKVNVFECYVLYSDLLNGMDEQLIVNYIDEKTKYGGFAGIRVGSLTEANNNAGNWEQ
ncbi:MAG: hypothetical protein JXA77_02775 [Bacteroidales bacterium]|nr:hypothetical protein [Bacteroidales bacterium]MBN2819908.1 hypothetical protein [Bacteroidales bacterium]